MPTTVGSEMSPHRIDDSFDYARPITAAEVDELLDRPGGTVRLMAGGTDLLVQLRGGLRGVDLVVDLVDVEEVAGIGWDGERLRIGAAAPMIDLAEHAVVRRRFAAVAEAARCVGSLQIQARATVAGNVSNASPAADTSPALLLYDAEVAIRSRLGTRTVALADFWTGPRGTVLEPGEWVAAVDLRDAGPHGSTYVKLGRTRGVDLAVVGVAALVGQGEYRVAACAVAPTVRRLPLVERALAEGTDLDEAVQRSVSPISDLRSQEDYRRAMATVCARRAVEEAARRSKRGGEA